MLLYEIFCAVKEAQVLIENWRKDPKARVGCNPLLNQTNLILQVSLEWEFLLRTNPDIHNIRQASGQGEGD